MSYFITDSAGNRIPYQEGGILVNIEVIIVDKTLTIEDSGKVFLMATDAKTFTLPATVKGLRYTFINSGADGNNAITLAPNVNDKFLGSWSYGAERVTLTGADDKDIVNTKATAKTGDSITIVGDGTLGWYVEDVKGIWLEESQVADDGVENPKRAETSTVNKTLDASDSGKVFLMATDVKIYSLPATVKGLIYTFVNSGANTNNAVTISPVTADGIAGTITLAGTVVVLDGGVDKDVINTKATSKTGDNLTIIGTGVTGTKAWIKLSSDGIWAREA